MILYSEVLNKEGLIDELEEKMKSRRYRDFINKKALD
jgi:hypothetical protein